MEENVRALSDIPAINRFLSYCRVRTVPSKTVLIHAGDLPDVLYYVISGSVEVMIEDEEGNEMVLAYLNKGQFFGEMGLFYEQPTRSAWVRTRSACELAEMTYPRFRQVATESPGLIFELATQLATRLDRTNRKLGDLAFVDVTGRVAHAIMDLCGEPDAMTHPDRRHHVLPDLFDLGRGRPSRLRRRRRLKLDQRCVHPRISESGGTEGAAGLVDEEHPRVGL